MSTRGVRVAGDRVYRPVGWWTPTVHALLRHLHDVGFTRAPVPLDIVDGHEVLSWIPGDSGAAGWHRVVPESGLRAFAGLLRDYHQATAGFVTPPDAGWALSDRPARPGEVICHGDFGPWNVVWDGGTPVGLLDFDFAQPGNPLDDVAYALEYVAPFRDDVQATRWQGFTAAPDRARRIAVFAEAYGLDTVDGLVDAVIARQQATGRHVQALAARGMQPQRTWIAEGWLDTLAAQVQWSKDNRNLVDGTTRPV